MSVQILQGDCREILKTLPSESVDCVVTSPPYWGLRDYGVAGQMGMEATYQEHVEGMADVFDEVRRVLKSSGTLWLNYGDSYATSVNGRSAADTKAAGNDDRTFRDKPFSTIQGVLKPKDLCGIPWRIAFALQERGWYLRSDIIWSKPNPMPESITDRPTKAHEYLFLLSKSGRYYFDQEAVRESAPSPPSPFRNGRKYLDHVVDGDSNHSEREGVVPPLSWDGTRNLRSVWTVATQPFSEAHFATFPPDLIEPCIKAGCPQHICVKCGKPWVREIEFGKAIGRRDNGGAAGGVDLGMSKGRAGTRPRVSRGTVPSCECDWAYTAPPGVVLDPFGGAGTTALVADRLGRNAILIELNPEYAAMSERRLNGDAGMFASVERQPSLLDEAAA